MERCMEKIDFYRRRQSLCPMPQIHRMVALILHAFAHTRFGREEEGPIRGRLPPRAVQFSLRLSDWLGYQIAELSSYQARKKQM